MFGRFAASVSCDDLEPTLQPHYVTKVGASECFGRELTLHPHSASILWCRMFGRFVRSFDCHDLQPTLQPHYVTYFGTWECNGPEPTLQSLSGNAFGVRCLAVSSLLSTAMSLSPHDGRTMSHILALGNATALSRHYVHTLHALLVSDVSPFHRFF